MNTDERIFTWDFLLSTHKHIQHDARTLCIRWLMCTLNPLVQEVPRSHHKTAVYTRNARVIVRST